MKIKIKKRYGIFSGVFAACALFLMLPVIFSDEPAPLLALAAVAEDEDGAPAFSLPVVSSGNPLSRYLRQAGEFYGLTKKRQTAFGRGRGVLPPAPDEDYTDEERECIFASYARERIARKAAAAPAREDAAEQAITVQPDGKGYYYEGRYYKNGVYPAPELKKHIESSITKFHAAQAAKQGKRAAYVLQDDGSLWVKYMPQAELDKKLNIPFSVKGGLGGPLYASGNIYDGARVASKNESGGGRASSAGGSRNDVPDDINSYEIFNRAERKIAEVQKAARQQQQQQAQQQPPPSVHKPADRPDNDNGGNNDAAKLLLESIPDNRRLVNWLNRKKYHEQPDYEQEKFGNAPVYLDRRLMSKLNIDSDNFGKDENDKSYFKGSVFDANPEDLDGSKVFFASYHEGLEKLNKTKLVFANFINVPPYDPDNPNDKNLSYTDRYYKGTGLEKILTEQMGIKQDKIQEIEKSYAELDKGRDIFLKKKEEFFEKYPSLKKLNIEFYYIIGKEGNNVLVATINSSWYATTPDTIPDGPEYHPEDKDAKPFTSVPAKRFHETISDPSKIATLFMVGTGKNVTLPSGKIATGLQAWELDSPFPGDLENIQRKRGDALSKNIQGKIDQQAEEEIQKKIAVAKAKKADEEKAKRNAEKKKQEQKKKEQQAKDAAAKAKTTVDEFTGTWQWFQKFFGRSKGDDAKPIGPVKQPPAK
ncbi:MAG: hypothetical protein LBL61_02400 [Elusimicrobiota bacterium]|nr:hypothetical protein [Elusimicrobiota bacterium]